jgi:membrane-associated phospholipid phosphatase
MERFGREYSLGLLGGFYVVGALSDDETAVAVAQDGLTSVILASGVITSAIKIITGRARPRQDLGTADFNPFGGNDSFPSGHSTHAFAIASVIANHYDEAWITYSSYGVASLVGLARSYHGGHFASDILAGGIIGTMVGKSVVEYNKPMRASKMVLMPEVAPGTVGIRMVSSF